MSEVPERPERCATCRFFQRLVYNDRLVGRECRRHAPVPAVRQHYVEAGWPPVREEDWCGDWQAVPDAPAVVPPSQHTPK